MKSTDIIIVDANVSLEPYLREAQESAELEAQLEKMGFEMAEEPQPRKIGFLAAYERIRAKDKHL